MPDSGDDAAMATMRFATEFLRMAAIYGRHGSRHAGGDGRAEARAQSAGETEAAEQARDACAEAGVEVAAEPLGGQFQPDGPGNLAFSVDAVEWDPECAIVADGLAEMGVPFARTVEGGAATFEIAADNAPVACALIDSLCAHVNGFGRGRVHGYEGLRDAAAARADGAANATGTPAPRYGEKVWSGTCETPEQAALVHAALDAQGISHYGEVDPETGAEEIFIAESELAAKGYRIPRAIRDMPGMPARIAARERAVSPCGAEVPLAGPQGARQGSRARPRGSDALDRDLKAAREQAASLARDRVVPKAVQTRGR